MKQSLSGGESIRLTNQTARSLRASAKRVQFHLHMTAVVLSLLLAALAVYLGMRRILYVPVLLLAIIALDVLLVKLVRFLQLSGLAICTEAAVRIMRGERAEQQRILQAERNLNEIHRDLQSHAAPRRDEDEDDDLYGGTPQTAAYVGAVSDAVPEPSAPPRRRRRQARLQVLQGEDAR